MLRVRTPVETKVSSSVAVTASQKGKGKAVLLEAKSWRTPERGKTHCKEETQERYPNPEAEVVGRYVAEEGDRHG